MCDIAYALLVEWLTAQVLADRQVTAVLAAAGAKGVDMPDIDTALAKFDAALMAEVAPVTPDERVLRSALGLSRAG